MLKRSLLNTATLAVCLCLIAGTLLAQTGPTRAPDVRYEPSSPEIVKAMLEMARVGKEDIVYDLGCGDGRVVIAAARDFGARGVGVDIDPQRIAESRENARIAGVTDRVEFRHADLFEADIHDATAVMLYLWPSVNLKLRPKLLADLAPGTRVVSHYHDMGDWEPEQRQRVGGHWIYSWTIPARGASGSPGPARQ